MTSEAEIQKRADEAITMLGPYAREGTQFIRAALVGIQRGHGLYIFKAKPGVWLDHPNKDYTGNCFGRITRLFYPWKNDTIRCMRDCCKTTDPEDIMMAGYNAHDVKELHHIVASPTHFDPTEFYWCLDCGRVGIRQEVPA